MSEPPAELWQARRRLTPPGESLVRGEGRAAAVLILLSQPVHRLPVERRALTDPTDYEVVLVEKRPDLRSHAGQIAFPGGSIEAEDLSPIAAALREAREETGIDPGTVEVMGLLPPARIPRSGFEVAPVLGWWREPIPLSPTDPAEIAAVHQVEVARLLDPEGRSTWLHPGGFSGPAFALGELYVWGFTANLLDGLFNLLGWTLPWDRDRTTQIPPRFLSARP